MNFYLNRFAFRHQLINSVPDASLGIVVVIPCCNESDIISTLTSLYNCLQPQSCVEVIVVVNASEQADRSVVEQNNTTVLAIKEWLKTCDKGWLDFYFIVENELPNKHAGVGLARKIGMDEAVRRFVEVVNDDGVIVCFDADSLCESNYLVEIERHFNLYPKTPACSIHFEHPISGNEFSEEIFSGIINYELHLRYYKNGLQYAGLPYAFHTIGSSMAVRSWAYQKQNGMNKKKAGEDFYFLQKLIPLGGFTELKSTMVIPSPRVSDRVPFGTGRAMQSWLLEGRGEMLSYHPNSFMDLKMFVSAVPHFYESDDVELPNLICKFLHTIDFEESLRKIKSNSTSREHFVKLFFNWFNAFKVLKLMHFMRDTSYEEVEISEGANKLLEFIGADRVDGVDELLLAYRAIDRS